MGETTSRNVSAGTDATGVPARKKSRSANPAITMNTGAPSRNEAKSRSEPGHESRPVWPRRSVGPSGITRPPVRPKTIREITNGSTTTRIAAQKIRAFLNGAIHAARPAITANPTGMMISNHHSGTPPASVSTRPLSASNMSSEAKARMAQTSVVTADPYARAHGRQRSGKRSVVERARWCPVAVASSAPMKPTQSVRCSV